MQEQMDSHVVAPDPTPEDRWPSEASHSKVRFPFHVAARLCRSLIEIAFPPECAMCGALLPADEAACANCQSSLWSLSKCCSRCGMSLPDVADDSECIRCRDSDWKFSRAVVLGPYRGKLREAVIRIKKPGQESLRRSLGMLLARKIKMELSPRLDLRNAILVPVPYHWTHALTKATHTAQSLAFHISKYCGIPVRTNLIRRIRRTNKQGMLAWSARTDNVRGAFQLVRQPTTGEQPDASYHALCGKHVLIVDDVLTSGATLAEVARTLNRARPASIAIVVVARGTGIREPTVGSELVNLTSG